MTTTLKEKGTVIKILSVGFILILAVIILTSVVVFTLHGTTQGLPLCIMYGPITGNIHLVITRIYGTVQLLSAILISIFNILILNLLKQLDKTKERISSHRRNLTASVFVQLLLVNFSILISWLPSSCIMFLSVKSHQYPIQRLFWVVLVLTPCNAFLNPCFLRFWKLSIRKEMVILLLKKVSCSAVLPAAPKAVKSPNIHIVPISPKDPTVPADATGPAARTCL